MLRHFIRGYFDGDGSIYKVTQGDTYCVSFTGTQDFLTGISNFFRNNGVNTISQVYKYNDKDIYDYKIGGRNNIKMIRDIFYNDASIFMDRKKALFDEV